MSKTNYLEAKLIDHSLGTASYTMPTVYVGLFTAAPGETGGGTEVSGNAYARQACPFAAASQGAPSSAVNSGTVTFPVATPSGWGTVTHFAIFDASSGGNMLRHGALAASKTVNAGDAPTFPPGSITVTED